MESGLHPRLRKRRIPAEIAFKSKEENGAWQEWRPPYSHAVPPWWEAGADYSWALVLAFIDAFTTYTPAIHFDKVVEDELVGVAREVFMEKLKPYEPGPGSARLDEFVAFVLRTCATRRAALSRTRWEAAIVQGEDIHIGPGKLASSSETPPAIARSEIGTASQMPTEQPPDRTQPQSREKLKRDRVAKERQALIDQFKAKGRSQGIRITDEMIAKEAKPGKWNDRTMVTWWKRDDPKCKPPHAKLIDAVLHKEPSCIWGVNMKPKHTPK